MGLLCIRAERAATWASRRVCPEALVFTLFRGISGRIKKVGCEGWGAYSFGRWYSVSVSWEDLCAAGLAIWCKCLG